MPDYSRCLIYKLCCKDLNIKEIYVGSTCNFTKRKWAHKNRCYSPADPTYNSKLYQFIRENGGFDNFDMILVEEYPCENKQQKLQRERYWYETLKPKLNTECPGRGEKEYSKYYRETHQEQIREYDKQYREKTGEERNIRRKETMTCVCGSVVRKDSMRRHERTKKHLDYINKN